MSRFLSPLVSPEVPATQSSGSARCVSVLALLFAFPSNTYGYISPMTDCSLMLGASERAIPPTSL